MRDELPFVLMRGGTSKGVFLRADDVPGDRDRLTRVLLDLFGSPDRRQIDGLGGADKLTSKAAIIGRPARADTDIGYLFGQVGTVRAEVDYQLNCGNLIAAVGLYAIEEGLIAAHEGSTLVRVHNVNTDRVVHVQVPVQGGKPLWRGDLAIAGVPGTGAPISLDFSRALGAITGRLLPTGNAMDVIDVEGLGPVELSVVDGANLAIYVQPGVLRMTGLETPDEIDADAGLRSRIDAIRKAVAYRCGLRGYWDARQAPSTPMLLVVGAPADYRSCTQGDPVAAADLDLVLRQYASGSASKALAGTLAATTGLACRLPGTVPQRLLAMARGNPDRRLAFGHPSGIIHVQAQVRSRPGAAPTIDRLVVQRTARRLAQGRAFLKEAFQRGA
ncbi:PrpF domain-containing protein [Verminephrobacter eiseniae]|uniref:PrpF domain-containing protein n=1 Tax=Verminephrobacter eiseniae TaxID=364317 RepID=UPI0022378525|nr:PrpF domain-containing protein [Verminephrobacter eiseniae]MCW5232018.1 3-methylitaconate isomerase [Verminephrobacter eiseniae]MCW5296420.1 3-methylitaconate isomerase [Verminephrobacter eiseniae]MCW8184543.1 3-methylitaconate isomerase [Verminephrobacter eiseniae]MCW8223219.1 3-methylitaconate isomerase [Verminephrobacter eiseniae]MCW8234479.1 3-methylitaconate isomerase [Verminephrobacter eiseniae]